MSAGTADTAPALSYPALFRRFLRFGLLAWGGPVAQIGMLRRELVDEERWISSIRFNRVLALYQVLPGPEAHELCVYFGTRSRGRLGGLLAGLGFMLPGFVLMFALSWLYFAIDLQQSILGALFLGMQPAVVALVVRAVHRIGAHVVIDKWLWAIAILSALGSFAGASFWITFSVGGLLYALVKRGRGAAAVAVLIVVVAVVIGSQIAASPEIVVTSAGEPAEPQKPAVMALLFAGLKAGLLTFGGAYTAIPLLRNDAVGSGWMTDSQFLDGIALSGILPAPLIIFSTFVGYVSAGPMGALAMTAGVFAPAFCLTLFFHDQLEQLLDHEGVQAFLEGLSAAVVGLIAATALELGYTMVGSTPAMLPSIAIFSAALAGLYLLKSRIAVLYIVVGAGAAGLTLY